MPTYDYECLKCKHNFEEFQRIANDKREVVDEDLRGICRAAVSREPSLAEARKRW